MLIIVPPSETKRDAPQSGPALVIDDLSFPELKAMRVRILKALIDTSARPEALERLRVGPTLGNEVVRNIDLRKLPTRPAAEVYIGPLHTGLNAAALSPGAARRAESELVIASSLWGLIRASDRIPAYRLDVCARLVGLDRLEPMWRSVLPPVLSTAAGEGIVLDLRSPGYQAIGKPVGLAEQTATVRIEPAGSQGGVGDVIAKRTRGEIAHSLLDSDARPTTINELVEIVDERWPARLEPPRGANGTWTIRVRPRD